MAFFGRLVDAFYRAVEHDELLRPMYPEVLAESKTHLTMFLAQYWGGPHDYMDQRGHPRLRLRHQPFRITKAARDAWLAAMRSALESVRGDLSEEEFAQMDSYFEMSANQLRNV